MMEIIMFFVRTVFADERFAPGSPQGAANARRDGMPSA